MLNEKARVVPPFVVHGFQGPGGAGVVIMPQYDLDVTIAAANCEPGQTLDLAAIDTAIEALRAIKAGIAEKGMAWFDKP